jgi:hypothetical protein
MRLNFPKTTKCVQTTEIVYEINKTQLTETHLCLNLTKTTKFVQATERVYLIM